MEGFQMGMGKGAKKTGPSEPIPYICLNPTTALARSNFQRFPFLRPRTPPLGTPESALLVFAAFLGLGIRRCLRPGNTGATPLLKFSLHIPLRASRLAALARNSKWNCSRFWNFGTGTIPGSMPKYENVARKNSEVTANMSFMYYLFLFGKNFIRSMPWLYPTGIGFRYFTVIYPEQVLFFFFRELIGNK
jgi:hypothetical protein